MSTSSPPPGIFFQLSDLGLAVTQQQYLDQYVAATQAAYPGWVPGLPADRSWIQAQVFASWAASIAQLCNAGASELFTQYGLQMLQTPRENGNPAVAIVTVTAVDTAGYTLPAGSQLTLTLNGSQVGFQTAAGLTIPPASSTGSVTVIAVQSGTAFNGAGTPAQMVSQINWITGVSVLTSASGGVDQEDPDAYLQRLAQATQLLGFATATAPNLATRALNFIPAGGTDQETVGRSTAIDGYSPGSSVFTVTAVNTNPSLTVTSPPGTGITAAPGGAISGTDIPASTIVNSSTTSTIVMSKNATGSASGISATVVGTLGNERTVTLAVSAADGTALNSDTLTAVQAYLQTFREVGFVINVLSPTYSTVFVAVTVVGSSGVDSATVKANIQAALLAYLTPANFALPQGAFSGWDNSQTVHLSRVNQIIQATLGVDSVQPGSLAVGLAASPTNTTADLVLPGAFPLPISTTTSIPTSAITVS